jgi:hypothetical protein
VTNVNNSAPIEVSGGGAGKFVIKRCGVTAEGKQLVVKNAFCYCAVDPLLDDTASGIKYYAMDTGTQGAVKGIMLQIKTSDTTGNPVSGPLCDVEKHPEQCVQAQCGATKYDPNQSSYCDHLILQIMCGLP